MNKLMRILYMAVLLMINIYTITTASAQEIDYPVQEVEISDSYLTKAHIKTNSKTQVQLIKIKKSFLVWVTVQKSKDNSPVIDTTK